MIRLKVNFTNILQATFGYKSVLRSFYVLTVCVHNFFGKWKLPQKLRVKCWWNYRHLDSRTSDAKIVWTKWLRVKCRDLLVVCLKSNFFQWFFWQSSTPPTGPIPRLTSNFPDFGDVFVDDVFCDPFRSEFPEVQECTEMDKWQWCSRQNVCKKFFLIFTEIVILSKTWRQSYKIN